MIEIVTFLWGDWCQPFGVGYVNKLARGIRRNTTVDYRLTLFTDHTELAYDKGINVQELDSPTKLGALAKVSALNPAHGFEDQVFIFDLDCVIVGSLDEMLSYRGDICVRAWFGGMDKGRWVPDGDFVSFDPKSENILECWRQFTDAPEEVERITGGRERMWYRATIPLDQIELWQRAYPGQLISYKRHCRKRQDLPEDARLVSFHGDPRPHEVERDWIVEHWR